MSPQLTIITTAMSLGGMASVGLNHYRDVEEQVASHRNQKVEEVQKVEIAEVGTRVETMVTEMKEEFRKEQERTQQEFASMVAEVMSDLEVIEARQSSHDILVERLSKDYTSLEFRVESQSKEFRPLRATDSRFQPVKSQSNATAHPLLPPVESSWTEDY